MRPRPIIPMLYVLPRTNTPDGDRDRAAHPQLAPMELGPEEEGQAQAGDAQVCLKATGSIVALPTQLCGTCLPGGNWSLCVRAHVRL